MTLIEKIFAGHTGEPVKPGGIIDIGIDARLARDFGGANVVRNLEKSLADIENPSKTFFTFDCNPGGSDQKYAANQQICREFARKHGIHVFDIPSGIGTHLAIDQGLVLPGGTLVSTDSHANIVGAVGAFGQGMGDMDIAAAWAGGSVWFRVPHSVRIELKGNIPDDVHAKDIVLRMLSHFGASGLLGLAAEMTGPAADKMNLSERITVSSMATEMGGIIILFAPNDEIIQHYFRLGKKHYRPLYPDEGAEYRDTITIDISECRPMISRPGHPEDVVEVKEVKGRKIDSAFIGSCTNGRLEDLRVAASILEGKTVAPGVVLKVVPSTRKIWARALKEGLLDIFIKAGALVGNPGCAGCAAGQIGQNGPGEVTVSTGNRNFAGKQGKGEVYLCSPATAAASALAGVICTPQTMPPRAVSFTVPIKRAATVKIEPQTEEKPADRPVRIRGRVWVVPVDNIDTDMIYHNRHLAVTRLEEMGQYVFGNLKGWEDFPGRAREGDIVIILGNNFGAGSSRQQAVDCFRSLGILAIVAVSFGAIYERNAINTGFPVLRADLRPLKPESGETFSVDLKKGEIIREKDGSILKGEPFSHKQMELYQRGGLLA
ncbi:MAG TPA: homoaconitate hydratase family protein [bacterium]|nr:homoaconitate hydratase family protein [bacterium]